MKSKQNKSRIRVTLLLSALVVLVNLVIFSCQREEMPRKTSKQASNQINELKNDDDCSTQCIPIGGPYIEVTDQQNIQFGKKNGKVVDIVYYNTESDFVIKVRSTVGWSNLLIDGKPQWSGEPVSPGHWEIFSRPLDIDWKACDPVNFDLKVVGVGVAANFEVNYNLIGICGGDCKPKFFGQPISCGPEREAVYTFIPSGDYKNIAIQGNLLDFKGEDATIEITGADMKSTQWDLDAGDNRHILIAGDVEACKPIKIKIKWHSQSFARIITSEFVVKSEDGVELAPAVEPLECPKN